MEIVLAFENKKDMTEYDRYEDIIWWHVSFKWHKRPAQPQSDIWKSQLQMRLVILA